ncbi:MAG: hypothetical protein IT359_04125 [Gemmatimonadaceae bacterium]|nr:hypothetical protein [Gemmatimonadaceae bacterium]
MRREVLFLSIALAGGVASLAAMPRVVSHSSLAATDAPAMQSARTDFVMRSTGASFEAQQTTATNEPVPPFDDVVLRRSLGGVVIDCGPFARPIVMDNGVERRWVYTVARPSKGACATVAGAQFVAVGKRGASERSSAATQ